MKFPTAIALILISCAVSSAGAAVLKVPADFGTIQAAVDAASAGDVVRVYAGGGTGPNGEYQENVVIDAVPVILQCLAAVIDVSTTSTVRGGVEFSAGITVTVDGVTIKGCTVLFAQTCSVPACLNLDRGDGIDVVANDFTADGNLLASNDSRGLSITGDRFLVLQNTSRHNDNDGLGAEGNDGTMTQNKTLGNDSRGIYIAGDRNQAINNVGERDDTIIEVMGNENEIRNNLGRRPIVAAYFVRGQSNTVADNQSFVAEQGFDLRGGNFTVTRNRAEDSEFNGFSLGFLSDSTISENIARGGGAVGFLLSNSSSLTLLDNEALGNGREGFSTVGTSPANLFDGNVAMNNGADGFRVGPASSAGVDCTDTGYRNNVARDNVGDGFDIDCVSTGVELMDNIARENLGTGIENDAPGTAMLGNTALDNRTDIAGAGDQTPPTGSVGPFGGNAFGTGGPAVVTPNTGPGDR